MKNPYLLITYLFIAFNFILPQTKEHSIIFNVNSINLSDEDTIFISGNNEQLGNWDASSIPLKKITVNLWKLSFLFPAGEELEFKFTKGSWNEEAVDKDGHVPANSTLKVEQDTTVVFNIGNWKDQFENHLSIKGQIRGNVEYYKNLEGDGIKPRDIIVWLPPNYEKEKEKKYPVLYMHDGQNIIDPATSAFGIDWGLDETADSLISADAINDIIIVGIYNTPDRFAEYTPTDTGYAYMRFIVNKLKTFIDKQYRTKPDRKNTATGGSSAGGLISFMLLWEYPEVFSKAICMSPAFHIDRINYLFPVESYTGKKPVKIYIDNGGAGLENRLQQGIEEMIEALKKKGYKKGEDLEWYFDKDAPHNESAWAQRVWRPLIFMFGTK